MDKHTLPQQNEHKNTESRMLSWLPRVDDRSSVRAPISDNNPMSVESLCDVAWSQAIRTNIPLCA